MATNSCGIKGIIIFIIIMFLLHLAFAARESHVHVLANASLCRRKVMRGLKCAKSVGVFLSFKFLEVIPAVIVLEF
jgi:hypothetical protein